MKRIHQGLAKAWLSYALLCLGRSGVAGVVLLAGCVILMAVQALRSDADRLEQRIAALRAELQRTPAAVKPVATAQSFLAELPQAEQVPQFIEGVHRGAAQSGVQIERAEYRTPVLSSGQVLRSQMVVPVTGNYPGIARWLGEVLSANPSAAIDEISLQRDVPTSEQLHARIVLSHYSRSAP
ncbi:MAG: type 4a pilus biogenesis protein PilO [Rhizobacter sp.]